MFDITNFIRILFLMIAVSVPATTVSGQTLPESTVTLLFTGDLTLGMHVVDFVGEDYGYVFQQWNTVGPFDVFVANLEQPITTASEKVEKEYNFKLHPRFVEIMLRGGPTAVNLANNHIFDYGRPGIVQTLDHLRFAGIGSFGAGKTLAEARSPLIIEARGFRIALLGYAGGGAFVATENQAGRTWLREDWIVQDISKVKDSVDLVVVNIHWGEELATQPTNRQRYLAKRIIKGGADVIVGHHPHVLQGVEKVGTGVVAYSLGNFVFGGNATARNTETIALRIVLGSHGFTADCIPVAVKNWQPRLAGTAASKRILQQLRERSSGFGATLPELQMLKSPPIHRGK